MLRVLRQPRAVPRALAIDELVSITVESVVKTFVVDRAELRAVDGVDLTVDSTRSIGIVGESGSGKSTLARMIAGLDTPSSGSVDFNGLKLPRLMSSRTGRLDFRRHVQMISQDTTSSFDPTKTLRAAVRTPAQRLCGLSVEAADRRVDEILERLELPTSMASRKPTEVSGGQRQRFAIARALVVRPRVLICDEVVSALDVSVQGAVLNLLKDYVAEYRAGLVFVSHGMAATAFLTDEIVVMLHGKVIEHGSTDAIVEAPQHEYTATLIRAARGNLQEALVAGAAS